MRQSNFILRVKEEMEDFKAETSKQGLANSGARSPISCPTFKVRPNYSPTMPTAFSRISDPSNVLPCRVQPSEAAAIAERVGGGSRARELAFQRESPRGRMRIK